jgi:nucleoid-associated protein YgaU
VFERGSRYEIVATDVFRDSSGREIPYKLLRLIPDAPIQGVHTVRQSERLDVLAHRYYRDPEQFWRICDANRALRPEDLVAVVARRLLIPIALR